MTAAARASSIGGEALRALRPGRRGRVEALFARSCYVRLQDDWVCLGDPAIGEGPLNLLVPGASRLIAGVEQGGPVVAGPASLRMGGVEIDLARAVRWRPAPMPLAAAAQVAAGVAALAAALPPGLPAEGLAHFLAPALPPGPPARAAAAPVRDLAGWLTAPGGAPAPEGAVRGLLGLGPGLTPSGDDFLGGVIAALAATGRESAAGALWVAIERNLPGATNPISAAHLRATRRAGLARPMHAVLRAMLAGDGPGVARALSPLAAAAHCSPWDVLAGCRTALRPQRPPEGAVAGGGGRILPQGHDSAAGRRFAAVTPPAITLLPGTTPNSKATVASRGARPGNGWGDGNHTHGRPPGQG